MELRDQATIMAAGMSAAAFILIEDPSLRVIAIIIASGLLVLLIARYLEAKVK